MTSKMTVRYKLWYILVGRSGSGKTTMAKVLESELGLRRCVTYTTRPLREGEEDGKDYHFVDQLDPASMFECSRFGRYWYGTSWDELSKSDVVILDPQGVSYFRQHFPGRMVVIQLERQNIHVGKLRMLRDASAGFDTVQPDILIQGDTIPEMSASLLNVVRSMEEGIRHGSLDTQIQAVSAARDNLTSKTPAFRKEYGVHELSS